MTARTGDCLGFVFFNFTVGKGVKSCEPNSIKMAKYKDLEFSSPRNDYYLARGIAGDFHIFRDHGSWTLRHLDEEWTGFGTPQIAKAKANAVNKYKVSVAGRKAKEWEVDNG